MHRKQPGGLCIDCYKRNGRLDPVHREDGSTLLPLPRGQFAIIDTEDYQRVAAYSWHRTTGGEYVAAIIGDRKKRTHFYLHRVIMDPPEDMVIDHINHNTLDNRKSNLRICTQEENMQNVSTVERIANQQYVAGTPPTEPQPDVPPPATV